jgi:precorrin-6A/cobalt-precorrin-6A reductase
LILVLAGTTEGRNIAAVLEKEGHRVIVTTATAYGGELLRRTFNGEIIAKPLNSAELLQLIKNKNIDRVIDATHPFALEISNNARQACLEADVLYERTERATAANLDLDSEMILGVDSFEAAAELAATFTGNIFLTIGSNKLHCFAARINPSRLVTRILPLSDSLTACLTLGISPANIIAMQGPFDEELNSLLLRLYNATVLVTKESGAVGGTAEKISAAQSLSIPTILITRPKS